MQVNCSAKSIPVLLPCWHSSNVYTCADTSTHCSKPCQSFKNIRACLQDLGSVMPMNTSCSVVILHCFVTAEQSYCMMLYGAQLEEQSTLNSFCPTQLTSSCIKLYVVNLQTCTCMCMQTAQLSHHSYTPLAHTFT